MKKSTAKKTTTAPPKKTSADGKCVFSEKRHTYKLGKKKLTSVTSYLGEFFSKFDANKMAMVKAMMSKRAGHPEQNMAYWKNVWKESSEHGTRVHFLLESFVKSGADDHLTFKLPDGKFEIKDFEKFSRAAPHVSKLMRKLGEPRAYTEYLLYDEALGLAGQIDLMIDANEIDQLGRELGGRVIHLVDYKTNDTIKTEGYKGAKAKEPISDLQDCSYEKYTLQLSLYAYMLERKGYKIGSLTLLHLKPEDAVPYPIPYQKERIEKLLKFSKRL